MAGILDTARYRTFIAHEAGASVRGRFRAGSRRPRATRWSPLPSMATVGGVSITELFSEDKIEEIVQRTRQGGAEIVSLMNTSAYYAPSRPPPPKW